MTGTDKLKVISREDLRSILEPCARYYQVNLDPDTIEFYWQELKHMRRGILRERVLEHQRTHKTFPKVPHLTGKRPDEAEKVRVPRHSDHPLWTATEQRCMTEFLAWVENVPLETEREALPIDIDPLVVQAKRYFEARRQEVDRRLAISEAISGMYNQLRRIFDELVREEA